MLVASDTISGPKRVPVEDRIGELNAKLVGNVMTHLLNATNTQTDDLPLFSLFSPPNSYYINANLAPHFCPRLTTNLVPLQIRLRKAIEFESILTVNINNGNRQYSQVF